MLHHYRRILKIENDVQDLVGSTGFLRKKGLTEKDKEDLAIALDMGADWIAQSFVQHKELKIVQSDFSPAIWPSNPSLEWCPADYAAREPRCP